MGGPLTQEPRASTEPAAVVILGWPDRKLAPNNSKGRHWGGISDARQMARDQGALAARAFRGAIGRHQALAMAVRVEPPDRKRRDLDNIHASLKSYIDGIAAEIGFDDYQIRRVTLDRVDPVQDGRIVIELWPIPSD